MTIFACASLATAGILAAAAFFAARPGAPATTQHRASRHAPAIATARPRPVPAPPVGTAGTYRVARRYFLFAERARTHPSLRILHVTVRFPAGVDIARYRGTGGGLFPLMVFAPGFRQCARSYRALLGQWSSAGYVVAAVDFPLTSCSTPSPNEADLTNQPKDLAFVIQRVLALSRDPASVLHGLVAPTEIALAGHSDGGDTVAAMAAARCCRDPQVRAVVVLAGAEWPPLRGPYFAAPAPPMMFVQGTADTWNFPSASVQLYKSDVAGRRYYLDLPGADHFSPYEGSGRPEPLVARVTLDFLDYYLLGQRGRLPAMWRASRVWGVASLVTGRQMPP